MARIKTSSNYQDARLARLEGRSRGYEDMILLNQAGRVAEGLGACVLMVRDGRVHSPPAYEGALESITLEIVEELAATMGIEVIRRPIDRSELLIAEEPRANGPPPQNPPPPPVGRAPPPAGPPAPFGPPPPPPRPARGGAAPPRPPPRGCPPPAGGAPGEGGQGGPPPPQGAVRGGPSLHPGGEVVVPGGFVGLVQDPEHRHLQLGSVRAAPDRPVEAALSELRLALGFVFR